MLAELLLIALLRAEVAGTVAALVVLAMRGSVRRVLGPELAYRLWSVPLVVAVVGLFPPLSEFVTGSIVGRPPPRVENAPALLAAWVAGALALALLMAASEAGFRRKARDGRAGPAIMGVLWPRMVTPYDYEARFSPAERELIRQHEMSHVALNHPKANLLIAALQVLNWFNPVVHLAAACARLDQELACDARVVEARPERRRLYAETLLKAHLSGPRSPFACLWSATGAHPLETRLALLARRPLTLPHYIRGAAAIALVGVLTAAAVWATGPKWTAETHFVWSIEKYRAG